MPPVLCTNWESLMISPLDSFPEMKAYYTRLLPENRKVAGKQIAQYTPQTAPILGILIPASRTRIRQEAGVNQAITHVFYTNDTILEGDKLQSEAEKYYLVGPMRPFTEYTEAILNELTNAH
jgi:hypothetical protein